eukprot:CAMPEP_0194205562 /NCGR_PEP_ID=MMETSP0156-20130528/4804_1 /TAXON_ID=33649 /ORGANISM="Thalassionema nitzschioides, Strain L26-B" /LENGTH=599 /DNA_ID=CAMNT_0038931865 /DNA_START=20 /DNA_END=1819 /DNA_ORIENTATION=+
MSDDKEEMQEDEPLQRTNTTDNEETYQDPMDNPPVNNGVLDLSEIDESFDDFPVNNHEQFGDFPAINEEPDLADESPVEEPDLIDDSPIINPPDSNDDDEPDIVHNPSDEVSPMKTPIVTTVGDDTPKDEIMEDSQQEGKKSSTPVAKAVPEAKIYEPLNSSPPPPLQVNDSPTKTVMTIEHNVTTTNAQPAQSSSRAASSFFLGMSKPVVFGGVAIVVLIILTGVFAGGFFQLPGLNKQIDNLEYQVDRLENAVVDLNETVDELEGLIDGLNDTVANLTQQVDILEDLNTDLSETNQQLKETVDVLTVENQQLNETVTDLNIANQQLNETVDKLAVENQLLNESVTLLTLENDRLNVSVNVLTLINNNLSATNEELQVEIGNLTGQVETLEETNEELEQANNNLTDTVQDLQKEISDLEKQINRLETILLAINDTISNSSDWEKILEDLEKAANDTRNAVIADLELYYDGVNQAWICQYPTDFAGETFLETPDAPMGQPAYDTVVANVNTNVLLEMCLNVTNYELYVQVQTGKTEVEVTFNEIRNGVTRYTEGAINYYFNEVDDGGLTPLDWTKADYDCQNLTPEQRYIWSSPDETLV